MGKTTNKKADTKKAYIVETPVENYCGIGAGNVQFAYGKAEVHEGWILDWFRERGYKVTEKAIEPPNNPDVNKEE